MYLGAASSLSSLVGGTADAGADTVLMHRLWRQVRDAFPDLPGSRLTLEQAGGDHLLLIVDERRAFRFPRPGKHGFDLERAVLRSFGPQAPVAIPRYDIVDPKGRFASYLLIPGVSLTPARFALLATDAARAVVVDAATLLRSLHSLDPHAFGPPEAWPLMWSPGQYADRLLEVRLPVLEQRVSMLAVPIEGFLQRYRTDRAPRDVVLHGDLVGDHLLVDEHAGRLAGIIDFSDVALGDPAHDFLGFWAYGAATAAHAVAAYDVVDADPTLLARSRNHFIRYRIDRLFEMIVDGAGEHAIKRHSAALSALLAAPSVSEPRA